MGELLIKKEKEDFVEIQGGRGKIYTGNSLDLLKDVPSSLCQSCITSPPYWGVRDYGVLDQIGAESRLSDYIYNLVDIFRQINRILKDDGTLWLNLGDTYTSGNRKWRAPDKKNENRSMNFRPATPVGLKSKDLIGLPWRVAFALQEDGWYLRSDIIWNKPNCQPESVKDRPTQSHEYIFLLSKNEKYLYNYEDFMEFNVDKTKKRNKRTVWNINTESFNGAHYATFPETLIAPMIEVSSNADDFVIDPFFGAGTLGVSCLRLNRKFIGIELNPNYTNLAISRINNFLNGRIF